MKLKWSYNFRKGLQGPMVSDNHVILGDKLYFALSLGICSFESVIIELDLKTQEAKTLYEENHVLRSVGEFEDNKFYFTSFKGVAYCMDLTGHILWQTKIGNNNAAWNTVIDGDKLYMSNYSLYCLNKKTGAIVWVNKDHHEKSGASIAFDENYIYHGELDGSVYCIDKNTGETRWDYGKKQWISNCILLENHCLLICNIHSQFLFLDATNGKLLNTVDAKGYLYKKPVFNQGRIYVGADHDVWESTSGYMTCYEFNEKHEMKEVFSVTVNGGISTAAVIEGEKLFFASEDGYLYCINKDTGEEIMKKKKTKGTCRNIVIKDGELIILSDKGQVECYTNY